MVEVDHLDYLSLLPVMTAAQFYSRLHHFGKVADAAVPHSERHGIVHRCDSHNRLQQQRWYSFLLEMKRERYDYRHDDSRNHEARALQNLATYKRVRVDDGNDGGGLPERED